MSFVFSRVAPVLVLAIAACSAADPESTPSPADAAISTVAQSSDPLSDRRWWPPVETQACRAMAPFATLEALVDSAAFARGVMDAEVRGIGYVLWAISYDDNGILADTRVLESSLPEERVAQLGMLLRSSLRSQDRGMWQRLRLDLDASGATELRTAGAQYCDPALRNLDAVRFALAAADREGSVEVRLYIDTDGIVQDRSVVQSSGNEVTDRVALGVVGGMQYSPAHLERVPVPSWLNYRVNFR